MQSTFNAALCALDFDTLNETQKIHLSSLWSRTFAPHDSAYAWSVHDAIVDHSQRDGVEVHELSRLLRFLYATFPVVISDTRETLDGVKYTHLTGLALTAGCDKYIWCGVCLTQFKPDGIFETCIADENHFPSLLALISK